jgi:two-component system response regulator
VSDPKLGATAHLFKIAEERSQMLTTPILLVEDNSDDEELTKKALRKNKITNELVVARDGIEALDYLFGAGAHAGRDLSIRPAMILLDLNLPRLDGHGVLRAIRADERTRRIPVIVLTSSKEHQDISDSYELGGNSYIRKSLDFSHFIETIGTLGKYWLTLNEAAA